MSMASAMRPATDCLRQATTVSLASVAARTSPMSRPVQLRLTFPLSDSTKSLFTFAAHPLPPPNGLKMPTTITTITPAPHQHSSRLPSPKQTGFYSGRAAAPADAPGPATASLSRWRASCSVACSRPLTRHEAPLRRKARISAPHTAAPRRRLSWSPLSTRAGCRFCRSARCQCIAAAAARRRRCFCGHGASVRRSSGSGGRRSARERHVERGHAAGRSVPAGHGLRRLASTACNGARVGQLRSIRRDTCAIDHAG